MKTDLLFEFSVDKENSKVEVKREFDAPRSEVWKAWTDPEILDQWWAPKPWISNTKSMDFRVGGRRLYAMVAPEGKKHWSVAEFKSITPERNFEYMDGFSDDQGNLNEEYPRSIWSVDFEERDETTLVTIHIRHESLADLETIMDMGFKEGFTMALGNLEQVLENE